MTRFKSAALALGAASTLALTGCVTDPVTGRQTISKAALGGLGGALGGYLLGDIVGGRNDRTAKIVGAGIGAIGGAGIGYYMDQQERRLRQETAGTGVNVVRQGDNLVLDMPSDVTFALNSSTVEPQFRATLDRVAATLQQFPSTYIDVLGHTDSSGPADYNQRLSEQRASAVASVLIGDGVQPARIATRGYGETQLKCPETTEEGRRCNRRVEIRVVPITQQDVQTYR